MQFCQQCAWAKSYYEQQGKKLGQGAVPQNIVPSSEPFKPCQEEENRHFDSLDDAVKLFSGLVDCVPTFEEALSYAEIENQQNITNDSQELARNALKKESIKRLGLTFDECVAISCYTQEIDGGKGSPYKVINEGIAVTRNQKSLMKLRKLLFLFISGLRKLPRSRPTNNVFYRGIKTKAPLSPTEANGHQFYAEGNIVTWWGFTSTSEKVNVIKNFATGSTGSTTFNIVGKDLWGYKLTDFSLFDEAEILLEIEAKVKVLAVVETSESAVSIKLELQPFTHLVLESVIPARGYPLTKF